MALLLLREVSEGGDIVSGMSVKSWPTYLLRDIPEATRAALEEDANLDGRGLAEVVREILCAHYDLDCEAVENSGPPPGHIRGTSTMLLRLQPELREAIRADAGPDRGATNRVIHEILAEHYGVRSGP